jgi:hypothetical protein
MCDILISPVPHHLPHHTLANQFFIVSNNSCKQNDLSYSSSSSLYNNNNVNNVESSSSSSSTKELIEIIQQLKMENSFIRHQNTILLNRKEEFVERSVEIESTDFKDNNDNNIQQSNQIEIENINLFNNQNSNLNSSIKRYLFVCLVLF